MTVAAAYAYCRAVAKREAKNFYYSFRVLPAAKSDAMCAVYAFMRKADDLADDESKPMDQRREEMAAWLAAWRASRAGGATDDPVFVALADTQRCFNISDALLEQLVQGVTMDLEDAPGGTIQVDVAGKHLQGYETFDDLYRYCYLVASVVGLVSIKIFGYTDPAAELLAERTGIAFQLTNILRDVKEDVTLNRVYLPQAMLREFGVSNEELLAMTAAGKADSMPTVPLMHELSRQAWDYYESAQKLLPLINPDSRAALWVLVEIYSRLLRHIDHLHGDVFSTRASVPTFEKLSILARGGLMAMRAKRP